MSSLNLLKSTPSSCPSSLNNNRKTKLQDILQLWNGIGPSLLLTSNPAINFTVFDTLKSVILKNKKRQGKDKHSLGFGEAFVLGIIAKFASTIMTYPLIRTKMILMCAKRNQMQQQQQQQQQQRRYSSSSLMNRIGNDNSTMTGVLRTMYEKGGVKEMYKGCGLTLLLTLFRASVFMMSRDKITEKVVG